MLIWPIRILSFAILWTLCLFIMSIFRIFISHLTGAGFLPTWFDYLMTFLLGLLFWGSYKTFTIERDRLNRKKELGI